DGRLYGKTKDGGGLLPVYSLPKRRERNEKRHEARPALCRRAGCSPEPTVSSVCERRAQIEKLRVEKRESTARSHGFEGELPKIRRSSTRCERRSDGFLRWELQRHGRSTR